MLDEICSKILNLCEKNIEVENLEFDHYIIDNYLGDLSQKGLGSFYDTKVHVEKILPFAPMVIDDKFILINLFIEFANACNEECHYCGKDESKLWQSCRSCVMGDRKKGELNLELVSSYMQMVKKYKPLNIIIRGGNPFFKDKELLFHFLNKIDKHTNSRITIVSNGMNINEDDIIRLKTYQNEIILNIVYLGICEQDYVRTNANPNMLTMQNELIDILEDKKIPYLISVNISDRIENSLEDVDSYFNKHRGKTPIICEYFSDKKGLFSSKESRRKLNGTLNEIDFYSRRKYNPCLFGTMSIGISQEITPCPGINRNVGALHPDGTCNIDIELRESYWKLTKDDNKNCKICGLKYMCTDCIALDLDYSQGCTFYDYIMENNSIDVIGAI